LTQSDNAPSGEYQCFMFVVYLPATYI